MKTQAPTDVAFQMNILSPLIFVNAVPELTKASLQIC